LAKLERDGHLDIVNEAPAPCRDGRSAGLV
jgi:hypothetical protein